MHDPSFPKRIWPNRLDSLEYVGSVHAKYLYNAFGRPVVRYIKDSGSWAIESYYIWDGDQIAGTLIAAPELGGGWVASIGVREPWRRRGLGLALLRRSFGQFWDRGERRVQLGVDAGNATGALRLYERAGMHVVWEAVVYEKELEP